MNEKAINIGLKIGPELLRRVDDEATRDKRNRSDVIRLALEFYLDHKGERHYRQGRAA